MITRWINRGETEVPVDISKVEEKKNAKYIGDFCIRDRNGNWSESPVQIYFNEVPPNPSYSQYFGILTRGNDVYICDGSTTADIEITGVEANDGEIIYSRYRHDYRVSKDGTAMIDGGRDYTKTFSPAKYVKLMIKDGDIRIIE